MSVMFIQHITIHNLGSILYYDADLSPGVNFINSRRTEEISVALALLLCRKINPEPWLQASTYISAKISLKNTVYTVRAVSQKGRPHLSVTDPSGADATKAYQYILSHCPEQDELEVFDGQDKSIPLRLYRYRNRQAYNDLSRGTRQPPDTKTFRAYLLRYIKTFQPEPINSKKAYQVNVNSRGEFEPFLPGRPGKVYLSETEEKLFLYICFLNIAEFWADFERLRDLHHEKKPLLIQNFLEFLDEGANISSLLARTQKLHRQIMILTSPMDEELKKKWMSENNGIFLKSCSAVCSL